MKIIITGASGLVGKALTQELQKRGHQTFALRHEDNNPNHKKDLTWSIKFNYVNLNGFQDADVLIHLAGANIAKPWTTKHKEDIFSSRVRGTELLVEELLGQNVNIKHFISTSATGYYPDPGMELSETSAAGTGFLSEVCKGWEKPLERLKKTHIQSSVVRTGLVLSNQAGVFPTLTMTLKMGVVPSTGSKNNIWSWIHIHDLVNIYADLAEGKIQPGIYNGVAPHPTTQGKLIQAIFKFASFPKKRFNPVAISPNVPAWFLKLVMGERSQIALTSQQVRTHHLIESGFTFRFNQIEEAVSELIQTS
jgi:hypothetical protein